MAASPEVLHVQASSDLSNYMSLALLSCVGDPVFFCRWPIWAALAHNLECSGESSWASLIYSLVRVGIVALQVINRIRQGLHSFRCHVYACTVLPTKRFIAQPDP